MVELGILLKNDFTVNIKANVVLNLTGSFEKKKLITTQFKKYCKNMSLLILYPEVVKNVILIYLVSYINDTDIVSIKRITLKDGLYLLGSKLGWILSGRKQSEDLSAPENSLAASTYSSSQLAA